MARITKKDLEERIKILEEDLLEIVTINKIQEEIIVKNKNKLKVLKDNKTKVTELKQETVTLNLICVTHKEKIKEYASIIISLKDKLKIKVVKESNFLIVIKNWLNSFKEKNNKSYIIVYTSLLIILGFTFATSALGLGLIGTIISKGVGSFIFNIINILYITLFIYIVGIFQDWWNKLYNKLKELKELKEERNKKSN